MTEEGYEVMGPGGGANPAIPAFPATGGGPPAPPPPPSAGGIPNFPTASHGSAVAAPPSKQASETDNKKAISVEEKPSSEETKIGRKIKKPTHKRSMIGGSEIPNKKELKSRKKSVISKKQPQKSTSAMEEYCNSIQSSKVFQSRMSGATEGSSATQRPNSCDTCQLALILFLMVLVIAIAIPVMLTASRIANIEFIQKGLFKND